ncbi:ROK family transcriptional regulator [Streptomyces ochraceiscleroticus]|uniref:ROK family protein n=1 Tax=Streptomyces ochraceiscleroticus TaxID=47761 RepID=A0ABW1MNU9_9ACTN|nr:ROK family transcriptional regulator [Streptomyces ochraceiscleroticus]
MADEKLRPSARHIREVNLRTVLHHMWDSGPVTGSDLMASTGLTRATVHDVCEELVHRGWIQEVENQREHGDYRMGRPARRYSFRPTAGVLVGVDCGLHSTTATVTDLRGRSLTRHSRPFSSDRHSAEERLDVLSRTILEALEATSPAVSQVLTVAVGIPAPVDAHGRTVGTANDYWERMNPNIAGHLAHRHGWTALVDNDANLAALAEGWQGAGRGLENYVTLIAGELLGAGIVEGGRFLRGARGGAGEMHFLNLVEGVGSPFGPASLLRDWVREAVRDPEAHPTSSLRELPLEDIEAEAVFAAADAADPLATEAVERLGARFARIVTALVVLLDTERVVLAGSLAPSCTRILRIIERDLPQYVHPPLPDVVASELGKDVVSIGAVRRALDHVRERALEIDLLAPRSR